MFSDILGLKLQWREPGGAQGFPCETQRSVAKEDNTKHSLPSLMSLCGVFVLLYITVSDYTQDHPIVSVYRSANPVSLST